MGNSARKIHKRPSCWKGISKTNLTTDSKVLYTDNPSVYTHTTEANEPIYYCCRVQYQNTKIGNCISLHNE